MEDALRRLENILELLVVSQTDRVSEWDHGSIIRAFQWAEHCEHLYTRFHANTDVRSALESHLNDINTRLRDTCVSYSPVLLSELSHCQHKLLINLLRNPAAPSSVIQVLFPNYTPQTAEGESLMVLDQSSLITCKSAFKVLCLGGKGSSGLQVEDEVRGALLRDLLNSTLTRAGNDAHARSLLDSICSSGATENAYDVIAAALLSDDETDNCVTQCFILDWLRGRDGSLMKLCRCSSPVLCAAISRRCSKFKRAYWGVLKQWASCLEYDVMQGVWAQTPEGAVTSEGYVTFNGLVGRFRDLISSGSPLKEETERELAALKVESGDFDVKGISLWTDLIIELKL